MVSSGMWSLVSLVAVQGLELPEFGYVGFGVAKIRVCSKEQDFLI